MTNAELFYYTVAFALMTGKTFAILTANVESTLHRLKEYFPGHLIEIRGEIVVLHPKKWREK